MNKLHYADGPSESSKYSSLRDEYLHEMCCNGWANDSDGDVQSPTGYFFLVNNDWNEIPEIVDAFGPAPIGTIGHFIVREDDQGFVHVTEYPSARGATRDYVDMAEDFSTWLDSSD